MNNYSIITGEGIYGKSLRPEYASKYFKQRMFEYDPYLFISFHKAKNKKAIFRYNGKTELPDFIMEIPQDPSWDKVKEKLDEFRRNADEIKRNPDAFHDKLMAKKDSHDEKLKKKVSDDTKNLLKDNLLLFRKASRELKNEPVSDVTAGFPKATQSKKEKRNGRKKSNS